MKPVRLDPTDVENFPGVHCAGPNFTVRQQQTTTSRKRKKIPEELFFFGKRCYCKTNGLEPKKSWFRLPSGKLTWQWFKMDLDWRCISLLKMGIFQCHISLLECTWFSFSFGYPSLATSINPQHRGLLTATDHAGEKAFACRVSPLLCVWTWCHLEVLGNV